MKPRVLLFVAVVICLLSAEPLLAGDTIFGGIPDLGFFNFLQPVLRFIGLALLRIVFLIPGGEDLLIGIL